jgi:hypothetical protein
LQWRSNFQTAIYGILGVLRRIHILLYRHHDSADLTVQLIDAGLLRQKVIINSV